MHLIGRCPTRGPGRPGCCPGRAAGAGPGEARVALWVWAEPGMAQARQRRLKGSMGMVGTSWFVEDRAGWVAVRRA